MVDGTKIQKMSVSQNIICLNYEKYYRSLPILFPKPGFSIESSPLFCSALLSIILTKTCQGKVMKEKLNCVKHDSSFFILHSSFCESIAFAARKVSFDRAKGHVSSPQT